MCLTHLVSLDVSNNNITQLPDNFGNLVNLRHLNLYSNKLDNLPESFGRLERLRYLDLSGNPLNSQLMKVVGNCLTHEECQVAAKRTVTYMAKMKTIGRKVQGKTNVVHQNTEKYHPRFGCQTNFNGNQNSANNNKQLKTENKLSKSNNLAITYEPKEWTGDTSSPLKNGRNGRNGRKVDRDPPSPPPSIEEIEKPKKNKRRTKKSKSNNRKPINSQPPAKKDNDCKNMKNGMNNMNGSTKNKQQHCAVKVTNGSVDTTATTDVRYSNKPPNTAKDNRNNNTRSKNKSPNTARENRYTNASERQGFQFAGIFTTLTVFIMLLAINALLIYIVICNNPGMSDKISYHLPAMFDLEWLFGGGAFIPLPISDWITEFRTSPDEH